MNVQSSTNIFPSPDTKMTDYARTLAFWRQENRAEDTYQEAMDWSKTPPGQGYIDQSPQTLLLRLPELKDIHKEIFLKNRAIICSGCDLPEVTFSSLISIGRKSPLNEKNLQLVRGFLKDDLEEYLGATPTDEDIKKYDNNIEIVLDRIQTIASLVAQITVDFGQKGDMHTKPTPISNEADQVTSQEIWVCVPDGLPGGFVIPTPIQIIGFYGVPVPYEMSDIILSDPDLLGKQATQNMLEASFMKDIQGQR